MVARYGWVDPHGFLDDRFQVLQLAHTVDIDGRFGGEGAADLCLEFCVYGGIFAEVVDSTDEDGGRCVSGCDNDDFETALQFAEGYAPRLLQVYEGMRHTVSFLVFFFFGGHAKD